MDAKGVSHIAICVKDMEKSLAFYRDILGMRVTLDAVQDTVQRFGERQAHLYQQRRSSRRVVHVRYGDSGNTAPSLVLTTHPGDEVSGDPIRLDHVGISHLAFTVSDVNGLAQELSAKGVPLAGSMESFQDAQGNIRNFYVYDPDGILLQFDDGNTA
ncbi:MAG: VOC family protein [Dehalococcoidia bacterium]